MDLKWAIPKCSYRIWYRYIYIYSGSKSLLCICKGRNTSQLENQHHFTTTKGDGKMVPRSWYILVLTTRSFQQTKHDKPYESLKSISLYLFFLNQNHPTGSQKEHLASPPIPCLHLFSVKELLLASNFVLKRFVFLLLTFWGSWSCWKNIAQNGGQKEKTNWSC